MPGNDLEEPLERFLPLGDEFVAEPVREHLFERSEVSFCIWEGEKGGLTFPGREGMVTRVLSFSRMSRNASKSEYRRRTEDCSSLNAGMFVCGIASSV